MFVSDLITKACEGFSPPRLHWSPDKKRVNREQWEIGRG